MSIVVDQLLRLLHHCGMPTTDVDLLHGSGLVMNHIIREAEPRNVLFTGEARLAGLTVAPTVLTLWSTPLTVHARQYMRHALADVIHWYAVGHTAASFCYASPNVSSGSLC